MLKFRKCRKKDVLEKSVERHDDVIRKYVSAAYDIIVLNGLIYPFPQNYVTEQLINQIVDEDGFETLCSITLEKFEREASTERTEYVGTYV